MILRILDILSAIITILVMFNHNKHKNWWLLYCAGSLIFIGLMFHALMYGWVVAGLTLFCIGIKNYMGMRKTEMARATDGCGKTDDYRPVDHTLWERGWLRSKKYGYKCQLCNHDGSEKHIKDNCWACKGIGYLEKIYWKKCKDCKGEGAIGGMPDFEGTTEVCTMSFCQTCKGAGYVEK